MRRGLGPRKRRQFVLEQPPREEHPESAACERLGMTTEVLRGHRAELVLRGPLLKKLEECLITDREPKCMQRECAALVEAIVKHEPGSGIPDRKVLGQRIQPRPVLLGEFLG